MIAIVTVIDVVRIVAFWRLYSATAGYVRGASASADQVLADQSTVTVGVGVVVCLVAAVVFVMWSWRARVNAELLAGPESQRRRRGWVIGAWICPVVFLWFPRQIMTDIYRPSVVPQPTETRIVDFWWATMVTNTILTRLVLQLANVSTNTLSNVRAAAVVMTLSVLVEIVAAVLILRMINQITRGGFGTG